MDKRDCFSNYIINNNLFIFFINMSYLSDNLDNDVLHKSIITDVVNTIDKIKLGFIASKNNRDKLIYGNICSHCIDNKEIFDEEQLLNINNIVNKIIYG